MKIQQIRNATLIIEYANKRFLIDPMLGVKGSFPPFKNTPRQDLRNPIVELPLPVESILADLDAIIVTHLHEDHWDKGAIEQIAKDFPLFTQNEEDAEIVRDQGFTNVAVLNNLHRFGDIKIHKTPGQHGRGEILKTIGSVMGLVFQHDDEKKLYIAGDTVWFEGIEKSIRTYDPEVIVVNSGANLMTGMGKILMDKDEVYEVAKAAPHSTIIASHMEAVNHWTLSRRELRLYAENKGFSDQLLIPEDGELIVK